MRSLALVAATALLIISCGQKHDAQGRDKSTGGAVISISVGELHDIMESGSDIYLLDVRTNREFRSSRLSFADRLIPYDSLKQLADRLPSDKEAGIYCFCRTGRRSEIAARTLSEMGYTNVLNVTGGIHAWQSAGYKTIRGPLAGE